MSREIFQSTPPPDITLEQSLGTRGELGLEPNTVMSNPTSQSLEATGYCVSDPNNWDAVAIKLQTDKAQTWGDPANSFPIFAGSINLASQFDGKGNPWDTELFPISIGPGGTIATPNKVCVIDFDWRASQCNNPTSSSHIGVNNGDGTYSFEMRTAPVNASVPYTFTWETPNGPIISRNGITDSQTISLTAGQQLTVTAESYCGGKITEYMGATPTAAAYIGMAQRGEAMLQAGPLELLALGAAALLALFKAKRVFSRKTA